MILPAATFPTEALRTPVVTEEMKKTLKKGITSTAVEQGFLLGCSEDIYLIDRVEAMPCKHCTATEFVADTKLTNAIINRWSSNGVLFCGVAHTHVGGSTFLTKEDETFVNMLHHSFNLPFIWFGLIVEEKPYKVLLLKQVDKGFLDLHALHNYTFIL